ncbi:MAG: MmcQ/YjbR family DNA-binding protein [Polyangiales bacterium]
MNAKKAAPDDRALIERLRQICLALPEANERLSHGEPTWFAGKGKVFATLDNHHHGAPHLSVWIPQPVGAQEALIASDPKRFFNPPYVGPSGWVGVVLDWRPDWPLVERVVRDAFRYRATRKLLAQMDRAPTQAAVEDANRRASKPRAKPRTTKAKPRKLAESRASR